MKADPKPAPPLDPIAVDNWQLTGPTRLACVTDNVLHIDYVAEDRFDPETYREIECVPVEDAHIRYRNAA